MRNETHAIAVMDGSCALCAFGAKMVHRLDRSGTIKIAPIQGETGAALMRAHGLDPLDPDSWLFIEEDGNVTRDLDALIRLVWRTGGIGWLLAWRKVFPKSARDWMYARVARNRYAMFGRAEMCEIPNKDLQERLLP
ncbi:MAG: DCC1-like thiol-disulfide oxidoreductase family protein [Octadecabacter sp.]